MTAATGPRDVGMADASPRQFPVKTGVTIKRGWLVGRYPYGANAGTIDAIDADPSLVCEGVSVNSNATGSDVYVEEKIHPLFASGLDQTAEGMPAYGVDNQTFSLTDNGGLYPLIGLVHEVKSATEADVGVGPLYIAKARAFLARLQAAQRIVRGVVYNNQSSLTAFTVASDDGITYVEGDRLLLAGQTTATQNGIYIVGAVSSGAAALKRAGDMPAGVTLPNGLVVEVSEGTWYAGSSWKAMSTQTGGWTVGSHDPLFYPRVFKGVFTLASGIYLVGLGSTATPDEPVFLFSTTKSTIQVDYDAPNTITLSVALKADVADRTAGKAGTAKFTVKAVKADATTNTADVSTVNVTVTNW